MTERERWIVYPLLFLALGASLRDKLVNRTTTKRIVCQELVIDDGPLGRQPGRPLVRIGRTEAAGSNVARGYLLIDGTVKVQGAIDARQYAYRGIPFVPAAARVMPVITPADLLRAQEQSSRLQQANPSAAESPSENAAEQQPPDAESETGQPGARPNAQQDDPNR